MCDEPAGHHQRLLILLLFTSHRTGIKLNPESFLICDDLFYYIQAVFANRGVQTLTSSPPFILPDVFVIHRNGKLYKQPCRRRAEAKNIPVRLTYMTHLHTRVLESRTIRDGKWHHKFSTYHPLLPPPQKHWKSWEPLLFQLSTNASLHWQFCPTFSARRRNFFASTKSTLIKMSRSVCNCIRHGMRKRHGFEWESRTKLGKPAWAQMRCQR